MLLIGIIAANRTKKTTSDYILASREVGPLATALSAVSTCHSGFMFIGMVGFTYTVGASSIWMVFGWLVGDFIAWKWIYPKLRKISEEQNNLTIPEFVTNHLPENKKRMHQLIIAAIIFIFVSLYAAAQLIAGSKALGIFISLPQEWGIILGGIVVLVYSVSGGIRASIWTDVIQSIIMMIAMIGLLITVLFTIGGITPLFTMLNNIDPSLANPFIGFDFGLILYILVGAHLALGLLGSLIY